MKRLLLPLLTAIALPTSVNAHSVWTLYSNSTIDKDARIHIATFDNYDEYEGFNEGNCKISVQLRSPKSIIYWCEEGYFRK